MSVPVDPPTGPAQIRLISPTGNTIFDYLGDGFWMAGTFQIYLDPGLKWVVDAAPYFGTKETGDTVMGNYTDDLVVEEV